ncbi:HEAT repeat family protein [Trichomonas vaginalis G3]|uniref:HEAT repeat family protein n=1 Tax=Trichomonas vaginalis (strain ATCC PRA-98 / G3) TaxID=412133 RepID=A2FKF4_TRIV3|nr:meiotic spindle elongation [Trichomonas vaginalis G3]EAX94620.1 HEAT repeat family protein [Trichomonas vaginalis G3]KAI5553734.1 meiotic spindle elongation [Trichomonas vaginalis G3]|eukprot:XP_001307550.1 HEAT repeat family protein [Trichomonas vaginalis G3]
MSSPLANDESRDLIENLRSEVLNERLNAVQSLKIISKTLGPERSRSELLPYIAETIDNTEEVWMRVAEQLPQILEEIGGSQHVSVILTLLKQICEIEDAKVQETATKSFISLSHKATPEELSEFFFPVLKEMCEDTWHPLRSAAATILGATFSLYPDSLHKKLGLFFPSISVDQMTIVRRSLATALPIFITTAQTQEQFDIIERLITTLSDDLSHAVLIELPLALSFLPPTMSELKINSTKRIFASPRWQARAVLADSLAKIFIDGPPPADVVKGIADPASIDAAVEVRASIARSLPFIYDSGAYSLDEFAKFATAIASDKNTSVRSAVAKSIGDISGAPESLCSPLLSLLLEDGDNNVKLAALTSVAKTGYAVSAAAKHIGNLIKFSPWRTQLPIPGIIPEIARTTDVQYFTDNFIPLVIKLMTNESSDVRKNMVKALPLISEIYGQDWKITTFAPLFEQTFDTKDYQVRQTVIQAIFALKIVDRCSGVIEKAILDPVSNVRIVLAREASAAKTVHITERLMKDSDNDVAYYAGKRE